VTRTDGGTQPPNPSFPSSSWHYGNSLVHHQLAMASPPARSFFPYYFRPFPQLLGPRPPVSDGYTCDAFPSPRNGDPNQMIIQVSETCGAALEQEGETTVRQDNPGPERRSQQRSHGCISQLNMGSGPLAEPRLILDSGATNHAVGDISLLSSFRVVTPSGIASAYIRIRDGRQLPVAGVGTICRDGFHLPDVLYVPGFCAGVILVSVSKLSERGYIIMFGRGQCHVQDQSSGDVVGKGQLRGEDGLYHLEYLKIPPDGSTVPPNGPLHCHPAIS
jgi:hypothetical protein